MRNGYDKPLFSQILRKCDDRIVSDLNYDIAYSEAAIDAKRKHKYTDFLQGKLGVPSSESTKCLANSTCVLRSPVFHHAAHNATKINMFVAGAKACLRPGTNGVCKKVDYYGSTHGKHRLSSPIEGYATFGVVEYLTEYLEMLECVYPSLFTGKNPYNTMLSVVFIVRKCL